MLINPSPGSPTVHPVDVKKEQLRAVEVTCPSCGGRGKARLARPDEKICCKFCNRLFRITDVPKEIDVTKSDLQRTVVEAAKVARSAPAPPPEPSKEYDTLSEALEAWREKFDLLPRWAVWLGSVAVFLVLGYVTWTMAPGWFTSAPAPDDLIGRARFVAEGVARNQSAKISAISAYGTGAQAQAWSDLRRPREWIMDVTQATPIRIQVQVVFEHREQGKACTVVNVLPGAESEAPVASDPVQSPKSVPPAAAQQTVLKPAIEAVAPGATKTAAPNKRFHEVHWVMHWVLSPRGWMLEGKETYEAGKLR